MALIKCPECGKEISDRAKACPNCGCPIEAKPYNVVHYAREEKILVTCKPGIDAYILPILIIFLTIYYFLSHTTLAIFLFIVALFLIISIRSRTLTLSSNGICGETGILNKIKLSTPLSAVSSVTIVTDIFGRSAGYGTIRITCAQGIYVFKYMKNAKEFVRTFDQIRGNLDWH